MTDKKKDAAEAHARLDRLNVWVSVLHKRVEELEDRLGIPHLYPPASPDALTSTWPERPDV